MKTQGRCRGCNAKMLWTETERSKIMPVDPVPVEGGNVLLIARAGNIPLSVVLTRDELAALATNNGIHVRFGMRHHARQLYVSHFVTCPQRKRFQR